MEIEPWIKEMFTIDFDEADREALREALSEIRKYVDIWFFTSKSQHCWTCKEAEKLLEEIERVSPTSKGGKLVKIWRLYQEKDGDIFRFLGVDRVPTLVLADGSIRYLGIPAGEELRAFVETLIRIGSDRIDLPKNIIEELSYIEKPVKIEVIVTPPCPYCPYAALMANMFALASRKFGSKNIISVIVEAYENPDIADRYFVTTVPAIAINGRVAFVGLPYEEELLYAIKRFVSE